MKGISRNSNSPQYNKHKKPAENKNNLDSRENEEYQLKGDDITHNRREHHNKTSGKKKVR